MHIYHYFKHEEIDTCSVITANNLKGRAKHLQPQPNLLLWAAPNAANLPSPQDGSHLHTLTLFLAPTELHSSKSSSWSVLLPDTFQAKFPFTPSL